MLFCMRVMVGVIILYDHVHPVGAFAKTSKIDVSDEGHIHTNTHTVCAVGYECLYVSACL